VVDELDEEPGPWAIGREVVPGWFDEAAGCNGAVAVACVASAAEGLEAVSVLGGATFFADAPASASVAPAASRHWTGPTPTSVKPRARAVAAVRSHSRPATNGPRSITGTVIVRPPKEKVTSVPHGSDLCATP